VRNLEFDISAFEDLTWWIRQDRAKALRIVNLIKEVMRDPMKGIGKPEPLKHELKGCWSRRIDQEHRLVYQITEDKIRVLACRYHY
jgi:toxin YoeB